MLFDAYQRADIEARSVVWAEYLSIPRERICALRDHVSQRGLADRSVELWVDGLLGRFAEICDYDRTRVSETLTHAGTSERSDEELYGILTSGGDEPVIVSALIEFLSRGTGTDTAREHLRSVPASTTMIAYDRIDRLELKRAERVEDVLVSDILTQMRSKSLWRLPVFDHGGRVLCVVHRSVASEFLATQAGDPAELTIGDMKSKASALYDRILAFGIVAAGANLDEVKRTMEQIHNCKDAFLTKHGEARGPVVGWIRNVELSRTTIGREGWRSDSTPECGQ